MTKLLNQLRCFLVAEIGINANGNVQLASDLIRLAKQAGFDCVKFQKRTVEVVYSKEELDKYRESPWGTTNREQKYGLEFGKAEYDEIDRVCKQEQILWTASPWDESSVDFLLDYDVPYLKLASACITDKELLIHCAKSGKPIWLSTGMSNVPMIRRAVNTIHRAHGRVDLIYHCTSTYPSEIEELNLLGVVTLREEFPDIAIGYSGHETGVIPSVAAAVLGAQSVERHITLNRAMYGSDQAASLEPKGFTTLCRDIRAWEIARGDGNIKIESSEEPIIEKLRRKVTNLED